MSGIFLGALHIKIIFFNPQSNPIKFVLQMNLN